MFKFKAKAEVRNINIRAENHGDEVVPAVDVKLICEAVPVAGITSAIGNVESLYGDDNLPLLGDCEPQKVRHGIENVEVKIGQRKYSGVDVAKGMVVELLPGRTANITMTVQINSKAVDVVSALMPLIRDEVKVDVAERQGDMLS